METEKHKNENYPLSIKFVHLWDEKLGMNEHKDIITKT